MAKFEDRKDVNNNWVGTKGDDTMRGYGGNDTMDGAGGNDFLSGGDGNDVLRGGAGTDYIRGGSGTDTLFGGAGADNFEFIASADSNAAAGIDTIRDFNPDEGDMIYFGNLVYPGPNQPNPPMYFVETATGQRNELTLDLDGHGNTVANFYLADGNTNPDLTFILTGEFTDPDGFWSIIG